jgi:hypothetical protein
MDTKLMKYLKPFLIIILINPFLSWIFDLVLGREHQIWRYILSGPLVGILFVIILYFQDKKKEKKDKK